MSGVSRIGHMALRVPDLEAAIAFHAEVLGLVETERQGGVSYLTCNERHHELILIESSERGYDHIGLEVPDPETLERLRSGVAAAGGELIGPTYDGEPGIDRAGFVRGPGGHVYKLFCGMEEVAAPPAGGAAGEVRARLGEGAAAGSHRALLRRRPRLPLLRPDGEDGELVALRRRPPRTCGHIRPPARALPLRLDAPRPERDRPRGRPPARPGPQADLGAEPPRPRQQPLPLLPRRGRGDDRVLRRDGEDAARWRLSGRQWPGGLGAINQWGGPPPPRFLLTGFPIAPGEPHSPQSRPGTSVG